MKTMELFDMLVSLASKSLWQQIRKSARVDWAELNRNLHCSLSLLLLLLTTIYTLVVLLRGCTTCLNICALLPLYSTPPSTSKTLHHQPSKTFSLHAVWFKKWPDSGSRGFSKQYVLRVSLAWPHIIAIQDNTVYDVTYY